jgi:heme exporter protein D
MEEFDPWKWTGHIYASYALTALVLAALVLWLVYDGRRQNRALADLEARGVKRRSERA